MAGSGFQSVVANRAQIPWFATTGITPWQTAIKCTTVCHNSNNPLANRSPQFATTVITPWQTALKYYGLPQHE
jgi:lysozyme family protein